MNYGEALFIGLLAGALIAIGLEIAAQLAALGGQVSERDDPPPVHDDGAADLAGDVEHWLRQEGY